MHQPHASSTGPAPGPNKGAAQGDEITEGLTRIGDEVTGGIQRMAQVHRTSALKMSQMVQATDGLVQATFEGAAIASGQVLPENVYGVGEQAGGSSARRPGGSITVNAAPDPTSSAERSKSIAVQSVAGLVGALVNLGWISYFGSDAPAEVYAAVPIVVQLLAQGLATFVNNRPAKS